MARVDAPHNIQIHELGNWMDNQASVQLSQSFYIDNYIWGYGHYAIGFRVAKKLHGILIFFIYLLSENLSFILSIFVPPLTLSILVFLPSLVYEFPLFYILLSFLISLFPFNWWFYFPSDWVLFPFSKPKSASPNCRKV